MDQLQVDALGPASVLARSLFYNNSYYDGYQTAEFLG